MNEELVKVKSELKKWESEFARHNDGRKPGKDDIVAASKDVQVWCAASFTFPKSTPLLSTPPPRPTNRSLRYSIVLRNSIQRYILLHSYFSQSLYRQYATLKKQAASSASSPISSLSIPNTTRPFASPSSAANDDALSSWGGSVAPALTPLGAVSSRDSSSSSKGKSSSLSSPWSSGVASKLLAGANLDSLARKSLTPSRGVAAKFARSKSMVGDHANDAKDGNSPRWEE